MKKLIILTILCALGAAPALVSAKIYKWVDGEGNTHYTSTPPPRDAAQAERIKVKKGPPPPPKAGNAGDGEEPMSRDEKRSKFLENTAKEREDKQAAEEAVAKEKAIREQNCSNSRKRVALLKMGGRQFEVSESGERQYLDDAQLKAKLAKAQKDVEEWCK